MSEWYEPKEEDIDVDFKQRDVNIWVTDNECGNVYMTLTFDRIKQIYERIEKAGEKE